MIRMPPSTRGMVTAALVLLALLAGCGKKTEAERLAAFRSSLRYRGYRLASDKATEQVVKQVNARYSGDNHLDEPTAHAALAVVWMLADRPKLMVMEADACAEGEEPDYAMLVAALRVVGFHELEWPGLAALEFERVEARLAELEGSSDLQASLEIKLGLLAGIFCGHCHGNEEVSVICARLLDAACNTDYIQPLAALAVAAEQGHFGDAAGRLKELAQSEQFRRHCGAAAAEYRRIQREAKEQGKVPEDVWNRLMIATAKGVMHDIFTSEELQALWEQAKSTAMKLSRDDDGGEATWTPDEQWTPDEWTQILE